MKLKRQFEALNFSCSVAFQKVFYDTVHNMSQPIKIYIRSVVNAKSQLKAIGVKVDNDALKDVILMNLDDSFSSVCTSLLTQPTEPSFNTIHSILGSSTHIVHPGIPIKPEEFSMAAKVGQRCGKEMRSPGCRFSSEIWRDCSAGGGIKDEKGYRWCDPTTNHHCHNCGHTGHNNARCTADMPPEVKAQILNNDCTMHVSQHISFNHSHSHSQSSSPVDSHLILFASKANNEDIYYGAERNDRIVFEKCL